MSTLTDLIGKTGWNSGRGTYHQRRRRRHTTEVAGPYRDQSSVPSIRAGATRSEHRRVPTALPPIAGLTTPPTPTAPTPSSAVRSVIGRLLTDPIPAPEDAYRTALEKGVLPGPDALKTYSPKIRRAIEHARLLHIRGQENLGEPEDLTNAVLLATGIGGLVRGAGQVAAKGGIRAALEAAGESAAKAGASSVAETAEKQTLRQILKGAAKKAEPAAVQAARQTAKQAAEKVPQGVRTAATIAAKGASWPIRHPIQAPFAFAVPQGAVKGDPVGALRAALEGKGAYADLLHSVGGAVGGLPEEAISLPAAAIPSAWLVGKAGVQAAQGDSTAAKALLKEWEETGVLPKLASGDLSGALSNLGEHPLYGALEASGALNAAGRIAGAGARELTGGRVGGLERAPLPVRGTNVEIQRRYSRDLLRQGLQRAYDRTQAGREVRPDTFRGRHYLKEDQNRFAAGEEAIRREHARQDLSALKKALPKKYGRLDRASGDVVNFAIERILQNPATFYEDLPFYKEMIESAARELGPNGKPKLDRTQMAANRALVKQIDKAIKRANPEHVVHTANAFIELQAPILQDLIDLKLLEPDQAAKASATSFARVHMGAGHSDEHGIVDASGAPLSLQQIREEMQRRGVEPPGFLSHREPTPGDYYRPYLSGASLDKGIRTGESVAKGTQLGGIEALVRQLRRSRGLVDRAKAWNRAVTRFGIEVKGVATMADAKRVLRDPERYGLDPAIQPIAVARHPFAAKKREIEGALEHQDPTIAGEAASGILHDSLQNALSGKLENDSKVIFMPGKVVEQFRDEAAPSGAGLKGLQAATTAFKRAVLPFSPSFYIGNGLDNLLRTALAGVTPAHFIIGSKVRKALTKEQRAELLAGAHFSSVDAMAPHRSVESLARGYDPISKTARSAAEWSRQHGWKQAAVKFGPKMLGLSSRYLLALNAYLSEELPQRAALGKIAAAELQATQGSWIKALRNLDKISEDFAKGAANRDHMVRFQKQIEEIYGNYTRMSPAARKTLSTIAPFWTWMRAAYKFVYLTMPAHHSVATGMIAAAANATRDEREQWGLNREGENPVPTYYQGIPLPGGEILPLANYNSFDFASDPLEALAKLPFPQIRNIAEAVAGRDWKGEEIEGGDQARIAAALWALAGSFLPGVNTLTEEEEGHKVFSPHLALPHPVAAGKVEYARQPKRQIAVPASGSESAGSAPWKSERQSSGTAPWKADGETSSGKAPWK